MAAVCGFVHEQGPARILRPAADSAGAVAGDAVGDDGFFLARLVVPSGTRRFSGADAGHLAHLYVAVAHGSLELRPKGGPAVTISSGSFVRLLLRGEFSVTLVDSPIVYLSVFTYFVSRAVHAPASVGIVEKVSAGGTLPFVTFANAVFSIPETERAGARRVRRIGASLAEFLALFDFNLAAGTSTRLRQRSSDPDALRIAAEALIDMHWADARFGVAELSALLGVSRSTLERSFSDTTPGRAIRDRRRAAAERNTLIVSTHQLEDHARAAGRVDSDD